MKSENEIISDHVGKHRTYETESGLTVVKERGFKNWARRHQKGLRLGAAGLYLSAPGIGMAADLADSPDQPVVESDAKLSFDPDIRLVGRYWENTFWGSPTKTADARFRLGAGLDIDSKVQLYTRAALQVSDLDEGSKLIIPDPRLQDGIEKQVDRAFVKWTPTDNIELIAGAFENTFHGPYERDNIPIEGAQAAYNAGDVLFADQLAAKIAYHLGSNIVDESGTGFFAVEFDGQKGLGNDVSLQVKLNYIHFNDLDGDFVRTNTSDNGGYANDYNVGHAGVTLQYAGDIPILGAGASLNLSGTHNFGAEEQNNGVIASIALGNLKDPGDVKLILKGVYMETDADYAANTSDWTPGTNWDAVGAVLGVKITNNVDMFLFQGSPDRLTIPTENGEGRAHTTYLTTNITF